MNPSSHVRKTSFPRCVISGPTWETSFRFWSIACGFLGCDCWQCWCCDWGTRPGAAGEITTVFQDDLYSAGPKPHHLRWWSYCHQPYWSAIKNDRPNRPWYLLSRLLPKWRPHSLLSYSMHAECYPLKSPAVSSSLDPCTCVSFQENYLHNCLYLAFLPAVYGSIMYLICEILLLCPLLINCSV